MRSNMITLTPIDRRLTRLDMVDKYEIMTPDQLIDLATKLLTRYVEVGGKI